MQARIAGYLLDARLRLAAGDAPGADAALDRARPLLGNAPFPDWTARFARLQVESWLAQDRLRAAVDWADAAQDGADSSGESAERDLAVARVRAAAGDSDLTGAGCRRSWRACGGTRKPPGARASVIEALALQALAHARHGDLVAALTALERALRLAEPEGYVRLFADLGLPLARLLQEARARAVLPDYVDRLLAACGAGATLPAAPGPGLPEPLSAREQDVLRLLAAGLTNREIAATLVVSPETVKKHAGSIYGKLGVRGRVAAVARARALALLD